MLSPRQYEAIGRLTVAFNEIDAVVEAYLPLIPQFGGFTAPAGLGRERSFSHRLRTFRKVLELASDGDPVAGAYCGGISQVLDKCEKVSVKRNEYAHGVAIIDFVRNKTLLKTRSGDIAPDEKSIVESAAEAAFWASRLADECEELLRHYLQIQGRLEPASIEGEEGNGMEDESGLGLW